MLRIIVREFVVFSAAHPQLRRIITQECTVGGPRVEWVDEVLIRPHFDLTVGYIDRLVEAGTLPAVAPIHLYYLNIGTGPTMFVLAPECVRLTGYDPLTADGRRPTADG